MPNFQVTVTDIGARKTPQLIRALRLVGNLSLADGMAVATYLEKTKPCLLAGGIDAAVADHIVGVLREVGATAIVSESALPVPVLLSPQTNGRFKWAWRGRVPV